jgi:hypothetical protein
MSTTLKFQTVKTAGRSLLCLVALCIAGGEVSASRLAFTAIRPAISLYNRFTSTCCPNAGSQLKVSRRVAPAWDRHMQTRRRGAMGSTEHSRVPNQDPAHPTEQGDDKQSRASAEDSRGSGKEDEDVSDGRGDGRGKKRKAENVKVHHTTVALIPPDEAWPPIQQLRTQLRDKGLYRWPPHMNLLYPFVPEREFAEVVPKLQEALRGMRTRSPDLAETKNERLDSMSHCRTQCCPCKAVVHPGPVCVPALS